MSNAQMDEQLQTCMLGKSASQFHLRQFTQLDRASYQCRACLHGRSRRLAGSQGGGPVVQLPITAANQKTRKQAISVLKSLLANPDLAAKSDGSSGVDRKFVRDSLLLLTSLESVNLLDWEDIAENGSTIPW